MTIRLSLRAGIVLMGAFALIVVGVVFAASQISREVSGSHVIARVQTAEDTILLYSQVEPVTADLPELAFGDGEVDAFGTLLPIPPIQFFAANGGGVDFRLTLRATDVQINGAPVAGDVLTLLMGPATPPGPLADALLPPPQDILIPVGGDPVALEAELAYLKTPDELGLQESDQITFTALFEAEAVEPPTPSANLWSQRFGDEEADIAFGDGVFSSGSVVLTGYFTGDLDFGAGPMTSADSFDVYLAKFNTNGSHLWSRRFGDQESQLAIGVAVDQLGNIVFTGWLAGAADFGGGVLTSAGSNDIFLAKFDTDGNHLWSKRFGDAQGQESIGLAFDSSGNVLVTGNFRGTVDFGGGPLTAAGSDDIFLAKLDPNGNHLWSKRFGDAEDQEGTGLAVDTSGNVLVTGEFRGTVDFGGGILTSVGLDDIFVAKLDANGNHLWSKRFGDVNRDEGVALITDQTDNVLLTGQFRGTSDFGGGVLTSAGSSDIFLAKFDSDGNHVWSKRFGDVDSQRGNSVAVDSLGRPVITGAFEGTTDFGGGGLVSAGDEDIYLAKFDAAGNHLFSQRYGDIADSQLGTDVAFDSADNVFFIGAFYGTVDFGHGPLTSAGEFDIFVAKINP